MAQQKTSRLLRKASINFLLMSSALLILTAAALFIYTRTLLDNEIEEELYSQVAFIEQNIREGNQPKSIEPILSIKRISAERLTTVRDTLMYDPRQDEVELFKELSKSTNTANGVYEIKVRSLIIESEDIFVGIIVSFLSILAIAFLIVFFINRSRNERMWKPFFTSLDTLKTFSFDTKEPIVFESSNIQEFNELNTGLNELVTKIRGDYNNLKQFTEDVSHEAQTPLAIMQAKIENIINQNGISDTQYEELNSIQKDIKRLTQLNKRLILLAKIDNDQFANAQLVDLEPLIKERIADFEDLSENTFSVEVNPNSKIKVDTYLAEILVNNLLSNAIKYSVPKSTIHIKASSLMIEVSNTGNATLKNPKKVFERFYKEGASKKATGLGLSIVNKICTYYNFRPSYRFRESEDLHQFRIDFKK